MRSLSNERWARIELSLSEQPLSLSGHVLSKDDRRRVANAYVMYAIALTDAVNSARLINESEWGFGRTCSLTNIGNLLRILARTDVSTVVEQQKNALQVIRHIPSTGCRTRRAYRRLCSEYCYDRQLPCNELLNSFMSAACLSGNVDLFKIVNTLVQLISRLTLKDVDWIEDENIQAYKDFESLLHEQVSGIDESFERQIVISEMNDIVRNWFKDFSFENAFGQHGYGATNQVRRSAGTQAKYHAMMPSWKTSVAARILQWTPTEYCWPGLAEGFAAFSQYSNESHPRITRVQLVPKGINKKRVVSMEDTTNQFFQKIAFTLFDQHFRLHPEMRINLSNQDLNRQYCQIGSMNGKYGTIDLSSASDSVTWELVKRVFAGTPVMRLMYSTRTKFCELPDGTQIEMAKAYPMGSALCFPVECIVFSAVIATANRHLGMHTYYRVYGDDMVVHKNIFDLVVHYLKLLGFIVNDTKSFHPGSAFTESCGIECFNGVDVSPLRLSRKWDIVDVVSKYNPRKRLSCRSTQISALYDIGNRCFDEGYKNLRSYIIHIANHYYGGYVLYSHNHEYGFISNRDFPSRSLPMKVSRYGGYSPISTYVESIGIRSRVERGDDICRYSKLLESYESTDRDSLNDPMDVIESRAGAGITRVTWVRTALADVDAYDNELDAQRR